MTPLQMSQDPLIVTLRHRLHLARTGVNQTRRETQSKRMRAVLEALIEWDNDGQRTGHQLDAIVDAAREVLS